MRAVAEFVMRGRGQAMGTALVCGLLPLFSWLGASVVGLVVLRKGLVEGVMVALWAALPLLVGLYYVGDPSGLVLLVGSFLAAWVLRVTLSWELAILAAVASAGVGIVIYQVMQPELLTVMVSAYLEYAAEASVEITETQASHLFLQVFAMGFAYTMLLVLVLARYWQSLLFNPGGFSKEFHQLRLSPPITTVLVVAMVVCVVFSEALGRWIPLLSVPMVFAAFGLVHWLVANSRVADDRVAEIGLVIFYLSFVFLNWLFYPLLASVALMDSWLDIRSRILRRGI